MCHTPIWSRALARTAHISLSLSVWTYVSCTLCTHCTVYRQETDTKWCTEDVLTSNANETFNSNTVKRILSLRTEYRRRRQRNYLFDTLLSLELNGNKFNFNYTSFVRTCTSAHIHDERDARSPTPWFCVCVLKKFLYPAGGGWDGSRRTGENDEWKA